MTVDHSQVQELVAKLPADKLVRAYHLIQELADDKNETLQRRMMKMPLEERRKLMAEQAKNMVEHYNETRLERESWQAGDFHDDY